MANEVRVRANFVAGALDAALTSSGTSMSSPALADLPVIGSTEHAAVSLFTADSNGRVTAKEIVHVTAHTAAATTATIARGKEGTTGVAWSSGDKWEHAPTKIDHSLVIRKLADESVTSSTTLQDDDELLFAIGANEVWAAEFTLYYIAASTGDIILDVAAPTGATGMWAVNALATASSDQGDVRIRGSVDAFTTTGIGFGGVTGVLSLAIVRTTVVNSSTAGNVTLRWAQVTSNATATIVKAGSLLVAHRLA